MKKGYVVNKYGARVELIEVNVAGTFMDDDENYSVIDSRNYKVLWSSDGHCSKATYFGNKGTFSGNFNSKLVRNDVIPDLAVAKQMAQDLLAEAVTATESLYRDYEGRLNKLKQPVDWDSFPKDEYISPFTGKKA